MYSEWSALEEVIGENMGQCSVLQNFPSVIGRDVSCSVVKSLARHLSINAADCQASTLVTDKQVLWTMEVLWHGLSLQMAEYETINDCVNVYCEWLTAMTTPRNSVPIPVLEDPNAYTQTIIRHFYSLFVPRDASDSADGRRSGSFISRTTTGAGPGAAPALTGSDALELELSYEAGRAEAVGALCRVFCSHKTGEGMLAVYYARFYIVVRQALSINEQLSGPVLSSLLFNSSNLLRTDLEGIMVLLPDFVAALEIVLPEKEPRFKLHPSIPLVELRRASIHLLLSMIALPLHFRNLPIKEIVRGSSSQPQHVTFLYIKSRLVNLLVSGLQVETDSLNTQMLLGGLLTCVQDSALCEEVDQVTAQEEMIGGNESSNNLLGPDEELKEESAASMVADVDDDRVAQTWFRFLHVLTNPVHLSSPAIVSNTPRFLHMALTSEAVIDPAHHPCLHMLPEIFLKAMKGIAAIVDSFLGIPQPELKDVTAVPVAYPKQTLTPATGTPPMQKKKVGLSLKESKKSSSNIAKQQSTPVTPTVGQISLSLDNQKSLAADRPKCNSILHLLGAWLFEAALVGCPISTEAKGSVRNKGYPFVLTCPFPRRISRPVQQLVRWTSSFLEQLFRAIFQHFLLSLQLC
ncbi:PREDICTED: ral GTPase-activating protein subunit beta-like [Priapulus caudatus]|uniref:Ral GTPase-activating protein subunit beta-like n=1 Tax=Priapulus caudatus TaxID=37621 RepID=A0ABM1ESW9_PRICU|nr:PREDICTED: ral GTPase-activating protein subunit beta-like [Priapulus caudatus]